VTRKHEDSHGKQDERDRQAAHADKQLRAVAAARPGGEAARELIRQDIESHGHGQ
jgi:hypothetical protein